MWFLLSLNDEFICKGMGPKLLTHLGLSLSWHIWLSCWVGPKRWLRHIRCDLNIMKHLLHGLQQLLRGSDMAHRPKENTNFGPCLKEMWLSFCCFIQLESKLVKAKYGSGKTAGWWSLRAFGLSGVETAFWKHWTSVHSFIHFILYGALEARVYGAPSKQEAQ